MKDDDSTPDYLVVIQCRQVIDQTCSGYKCEHAFASRSDGFSPYSAKRPIRYLSMSCGGCPGKWTGDKLAEVKRGLGSAPSSAVVVHLSTCMTSIRRDTAMCPHLDDIILQVKRMGFSCVPHTHGAVQNKATRESANTTTAWIGNG